MLWAAVLGLVVCGAAARAPVVTEGAVPGFARSALVACLAIVCLQALLGLVAELRRDLGGPMGPGGHARRTPVSTAQQLAATKAALPAAAGWAAARVASARRLEKGSCGPVPHEQRYALVNRAGRLLRAWRIASGTWITQSAFATPALVGGDPVVVLQVTRPAARCASYVGQEYLVLRLARSGPSGVRFSLPASSEEGKDLSGRAGWGLMITDVRDRPGAKVYQLGSSPTVGVRIMQFSLAST